MSGSSKVVMSGSSKVVMSGSSKVVMSGFSPIAIADFSPIATKLGIAIGDVAGSDEVGTEQLVARSFRLDRNSLAWQAAPMGFQLAPAR